MNHLRLPLSSPIEEEIDSPTSAQSSPAHSRVSYPRPLETVSSGKGKLVEARSGRRSRIGALRHHRNVTKDFDREATPQHNTMNGGKSKQGHDKRPGLNLITTCLKRSESSVQNDSIKHATSENGSSGFVGLTDLEALKTPGAEVRTKPQHSNSNRSRRKPPSLHLYSGRGLGFNVKHKLKLSRHEPSEKNPGVAKKPSRTKDMDTDGAKKTSTQDNGDNDLSPSDRPIMIGLAVPASNAAERSFESSYAPNSNGSDQWPSTPTPSILITPAAEEPAWSEHRNTAWPRPSSSVYSQSTPYLGLKRLSTDTPPVPKVPKHYMPSKESSESPESWENAYSTSDEEALQPLKRTYSAGTLVDTPNSPASPSRKRTLSLESVDFRRSRASSGWWNIITTPFLSRSNSTWTKKSVTPKRSQTALSEKAGLSTEANKSNEVKSPSLHGVSPSHSVWDNMGAWEKDRININIAIGDTSREESKVASPHARNQFSNDEIPLFGSAAEYYAACRHDQNDPIPYFECVNHTCPKLFPTIDKRLTLPKDGVALDLGQERDVAERESPSDKSNDAKDDATQTGVTDEGNARAVAETMTADAPLISSPKDATDEDAPQGASGNSVVDSPNDPLDEPAPAPKSGNEPPKQNTDDSSISIPEAKPFVPASKSNNPFLQAPLVESPKEIDKPTQQPAPAPQRSRNPFRPSPLFRFRAAPSAEPNDTRDRRVSVETEIEDEGEPEASPKVNVASPAPVVPAPSPVKSLGRFSNHRKGKKADTPPILSGSDYLDVQGDEERGKDGLLKGTTPTSHSRETKDGEASGESSGISTTLNQSSLLPAYSPPRAIGSPLSPDPDSPRLRRHMAARGAIPMSEIPSRRNTEDSQRGLYLNPRPAPSRGQANSSGISGDGTEDPSDSYDDEKIKPLPKRSLWKRWLGQNRQTKKRQLLLLGLALTVLVVVILVVVLVTTLIGNKDDKTAIQSQWVNITGYPPIPTGVMTVARPTPVTENKACVKPTTLWSCAVPKEEQDSILPNSADEPNFRFEVSFLNSSDLSSSSNSASNATNSTSKMLRSRTSIWGQEEFVANPSTPSLEEQVFLGNTTDNNSVPFKGETTPFYISFMNAEKIVSRLMKKELFQRSESFPNLTNLIPNPSKDSDGSAAAATLVPYPSYQPLKLYNRGLSTEHYGFYNYFDRSIFLKSSSVINSSTDTEASADADGGCSKSEAEARCTWAQTRFLVQIWTNKGSSATLLNSSASTTTSSSDNITSSSANMLTQPGSFPYPITIKLDRHGGNINKKMIYCYGVEDSEIDADNVKIHIESRGAGGTLVNPAQGIFGSVNITVEEGGPGGIDGGSGGCECVWQNWEKQS